MAARAGDTGRRTGISVKNSRASAEPSEAAGTPVPTRTQEKK